MKILLGYSYYENPFDVKQWVEKWLGRLKKTGIDIEPFCLTLDPPGPRLGWHELDEKWRNGDNKLYEIYRELLRKCENFDVFINWNGINFINTKT